MHLLFDFAHHPALHFLMDTLALVELGEYFSFELED
jgi:hypothetical protein